MKWKKDERSKYLKITEVLRKLFKSNRTVPFKNIQRFRISKRIEAFAVTRLPHRLIDSVRVADQISKDEKSSRIFN